MKFSYFDKEMDIKYPTGLGFVDNLGEYIKAIAKKIHCIYPNDTIILVIRGHSGSIIAGGVATILTLEYNIKVNIIVVRKNHENSHEDWSHSNHYINLLSNINNKIIVLDDFISDGDTIEYILNYLDTSIENPRSYNMLCVGNHYSKITAKTNFRLYNEILSRFDIVSCFKP